MRNWLHRRAVPAGSASPSASRDGQQQQHQRRTPANSKSFAADNRPINDDEFEFEPLWDAEPPLYFVFPHAKQPGSRAPSTTRISGKLFVKIHKPQQAISIVCDLVPTFAFAYREERESTTLPPLPCQILDTPTRLEPGEYEFVVKYDIPCDWWGRSTLITPDEGEETMTERMYSQRYDIAVTITRQNHATGELEKGCVTWPPADLVEESIADVEAWRKAYHRKAFSLVCSPSDPGGLVTCRIFLPALPATSNILSIIGRLEAKSTYKSLKNPEVIHTELENSDRFIVFNLRSSKDFIVDRQAGALRANVTARLPDDRLTPPSSLKHTRTFVTFTHRFLVEILVEDKTTKKKQKVKIGEPITLASCLLIAETISLPSYGSQPQEKAIFNPERLAERQFCTCGFTYDQLLARESEGVSSDFNDDDAAAFALADEAETKSVAPSAHSQSADNDSTP